MLGALLSSILDISLRKVSDLIFLCKNLVDFNEVCLHEATLNLHMHLWIFSCLSIVSVDGYSCVWSLFFAKKKSDSSARNVLEHCCYFPYNENPARALNTTSLKWCLPSTDAINRWERNSHMPMKVQGHLMQAHFIEIH